MSLSVTLDAEACRPGQELTATVAWEGETFERLTAYLLWYTEGIGTQDSEVVEEQRISASGRSGTVRFRLPPSPYSFSGKLITLQWAVEALAEPGEVADRAPFTLSPSGGEVQLAPGSAEEPDESQQEA